MTYSERRLQGKENNLTLKTIYYLYVLFFPFGMFGFISLPKMLSRYVFVNSSTLFMWLGLLVILFKRRGILPVSNGVKVYGELYAFMALYSFCAATLLYLPLGELNGENTFRACIGNVIFYFIVLCSIYYNWYNLSYIVKFDEIKKIVYVQSVLLLIIGYIQLFIIMGIGGFSGIYDSLRYIFNLLPVAGLRRGVVFGGSEPSAASKIFTLIIPMHLSCLIDSSAKMQTKILHTFVLLLYIPLILSSNSSTLLITAFIVITTFVIMKIGKGGLYKYLTVGAFVVGMMIALGYGIDRFTTYTMRLEKDSLEYLLFGKIIDTSNLSTAMRSSTIINDMKIFFSLPFTGIGDGLQGYMYNQNMPAWVFASPEVQAVLLGRNGIVDGGGAFFPSFLSGYGLIGIIVISILLKKIYIMYLKNDPSLYKISVIFKFFLVVFVCSAWFSSGVKQNQEVAFMLAIPIINSMDKSRTV